jgi:hypothetical protein
VRKPIPKLLPQLFMPCQGQRRLFSTRITPDTSGRATARLCVMYLIRLHSSEWQQRTTVKPIPTGHEPTPSHLSRPTSNTITLDNDTEPSHPALEAASAGVKVLSHDEGEKDGNGQVMLADCQPCEQCGGKVVWATRGEWLLICEGCQEPQ